MSLTILEPQAISFPGSSPTCHRGRVGEDPGNEVACGSKMVNGKILIDNFFVCP